MPFRAAHHVVGSLVGILSRAGKDFSDRETCLKHLTENGVRVTRADVDRVLDPKTVMMSYNTYGGTGPQAVQNILKDLKASLAKERELLSADNTRVNNAYQAARNIAKYANDGSIKTKEQLIQLINKYSPK